MRRTAIQRSAKAPRQYRGFAHHLSATPEETEQPAAVKQHPTIAKWQQVADNSPRTAQMKPAPVVQRYQEVPVGDNTNYLVSGGGKAVLKRDGSKDLFVRDGVLNEMNTGLTAKKVQNFSFYEASEDLALNNTVYKKVAPAFHVPPENENGHGNDYIQKNLPSNIQSRNTFETSTAGFIEMLATVWQGIKRDEPRQPLEEQGRQIAKYCSRDLGQKILLYLRNNPDIHKEPLILEIQNKMTDLGAELNAEAIDQLQFLPTGCGYLKDFLLDNSEGKKVDDDNPAMIGNYHFTDYSYDTDDDAPWENHYATIVLTDVPDTISLEVAAGYARQLEKTAWNFKMYGAPGTGTSFKEKTDEEFNRRKAQQKTMGVYNYSPFDYF
ncbi:MAG TPA: hypothetical protein VF408_07955 [Sediminibacterium sp.]